MAETTLRVSRSTHAGVTRLAAERHDTIDPQDTNRERGRAPQAVV